MNKEWFGMGLLSVVVFIVLDALYISLMFEALQHKNLSCKKKRIRCTSAITLGLLLTVAFVGLQALLYFKDGHNILSLLCMGACVVMLSLIIAYYVAKARVFMNMQRDEEWVATVIEPDTSMVEYYNDGEKSKFVLTQES